jgi:hypothetical protein
MSACDSLTYQNVTPAQWAAMENAVEADFGIVMSGNTGTATAQGYSFEWKYDGSSELWLVCYDSPAWIPCTLINNQIDSRITPFLSS